MATEADAPMRSAPPRHLVEVLARANAAEAFTPHVRADDAPHELDVLHRRAAGAEAVDVFTNAGARRLRERAGRDLLFVVRPPVSRIPSPEPTARFTTASMSRNTWA